MGSLNKVQLIGHLGCDPTNNKTQSGNSVSNFSLATSEKFERDGRKEEETEWHQVVAWGKLAEICQKHIAKGSQVYIEGKIRARTYEDKERKKQLITEIVARTVLFLGPKKEGSR